MGNEQFWQNLDRLVVDSPVSVDRPKGTSHPRYPSLVYPVDYGYLENTRSGNEDGIDVWIGSMPKKRVGGIICTVDLEKRDAEIKILLGCTTQERQTILLVHHRGSQTALLVEHP